MPTLDDVRTICRELPEVEERPSRGHAMWHVGGRHTFVWERPFTKADIRRDGEPPSGDLLGVRVPDEEVKAAMLAAEPDVLFTISHFDGYSAVLLRLEEVSADRLREIVIEAWYAVAPPALAAAHPGLA